jgi:hypothetical protein
MSSRRTAAAAAARKSARKPARPERAAKSAASNPASKSAVKPVAAPPNTPDMSAAALGLAAEIERGLAAGTIDVLSPQAVQALMAAACNVYSAQVEAGQQYVPLKPQSISPTAVMASASGLLRSANLAVFELGMWQSWTGR